MMFSKLTGVLLAGIAGASLMAQDPVPSVAGPTQTIPLQQLPPGSSVRIYIEPGANGLESYVAAAMVKKHVPAVVTQDKGEARFVLKPVAQPHPESTGGKIARCLFLYCIGVEGFQIASVQLIDQTTQETIWAYTVHKGASGAYQSTAEAIAKHLKQFLEERPR